MRKILLTGLIALALSPLKAFATPTAQDISNTCGLATQCGYLIANLNFTLQNNTYITSVDAAGSGSLNLIKGNASDDTVINSSASDDLILQLEDDANRIITFDAASDTAISATYGDTTDSQVFVLSSASLDADDLDITRVCGGGAYATDGSRGACISLQGEDVASTGGDITYIAGASDIHTFTAGSTTTMTIGATGVVTSAAGFTATTGPITATAGDVVVTLGDLTMTSGTLNIPAAANLGLIPENAANTACDTTCTQGCVAGFDAGTSAFVACATATADSCLCAAAGS